MTSRSVPIHSKRESKHRVPRQLVSIGPSLPAWGAFPLKVPHLMQYSAGHTDKQVTKRLMIQRGPIAPLE